MQNPKELIESYLKNWQERNSVSSPFEVSHSQNLSNGDFATNIALVSVKEKKGVNNPRTLAESIVTFLNESEDITEVFEKVEIAGAGFINFYLSNKTLQKTLQEVVEKGDEFGRSNKNNKQTVIVEYSSPNIAKPFTIGHLRSTIIGDATANLLEATGYSVRRDNHLGDWGSQFGKQIYAVKTWGDEKAIATSQNPVKELVALYVKFHEEAEKDPSLEEEARAWFKKLEDGDTEARELWQKCITWSLKEFDKFYKILGVTFSENNGQGYGESFFEDKMQPVVEELRKKNLLKKDEEAELVYFPEDKYPPLMILKKDRATLYATRDLATDKFRLDTYGPDIKIINEVGIEQELYFRQLFEVEKMLGWVKDRQRVHIKHGHYRFADGKMSTRKGNVIWLEDVLEEARRRAQALSKQEVPINEKAQSFGDEDITNTKFSDSAKEHKLGMVEILGNAETISIGALKWNDLRRDSKQDIAFEWDDILNMQGNSGPYLQYTYVRTQSVVKKSEALNSKFETNSNELKPETQNLKPEETELLRFLSQYPYIVEQAAENFAPNLLCNYLFELSQKFNLFYQKCKIIDPVIASGSKQSKEDVQAFRLQLTKGVGQVLQNGLHILGIETVEKM